MAPPAKLAAQRVGVLLDVLAAAPGPLLLSNLAGLPGSAFDSAVLGYLAGQASGVSLFVEPPSLPECLLVLAPGPRALFWFVPTARSARALLQRLPDWGSSYVFCGEPAAVLCPLAGAGGPAGPAAGRAAGGPAGGRDQLLGGPRKPVLDWIGLSCPSCRVLAPEEFEILTGACRDAAGAEPVQGPPEFAEIPSAAVEVAVFELADNSAFSAASFFLATVSARLCAGTAAPGQKVASQRAPGLQTVSRRLTEAVRALPRPTGEGPGAAFSGEPAWLLPFTALLPEPALQAVLALLRVSDPLAAAQFSDSLHYFSVLYPNLIYELQRSSKAPAEAAERISYSVSSPFGQYRSRVAETLQAVCADLAPDEGARAASGACQALGALPSLGAWGRSGSAAYLPFKLVRKGEPAADLPTAGVLDISLYHPKHPLFCRRFAVLEDSETLPLLFQVLGAVSMTVPSLIDLVSAELDMASCEIRSSEEAEQRLARKLPALKAALSSMLSDALLPAVSENLHEALRLAIRLTSGALKVHVDPTTLWFDSPAPGPAGGPILYQVRVALQVRVMAAADTVYTAVLTYGDTLLAAGGQTRNLTRDVCRDLPAAPALLRPEAQAPRGESPPPSLGASPARSLVHYGASPDFSFSKAADHVDGAQKNIRADFRFHFVLRAQGKLLCFLCPVQPIQVMFDFISPGMLDCQAPGLRRFLLRISQNAKLLQAAASEAGIGPGAKKPASLAAAEPAAPPVDPVVRASLLASLMAAPRSAKRLQPKPAPPKPATAGPADDRTSANNALREAVESVGVPVDADLRPFDARGAYFIYCSKKEKLGDIFGQYLYGQFARELQEFRARLLLALARVSASVFNCPAALEGEGAGERGAGGAAGASQPPIPAGAASDAFADAFGRFAEEAGFCIELCPPTATAARDISRLYAKYSVQFDTLAYRQDISLCSGDLLPQVSLRWAQALAEKLSGGAGQGSGLSASRSAERPAEQPAEQVDAAVRAILGDGLSPEEASSAESAARSPADLLRALQLAGGLVQRYKPLLRPVPKTALKSKVAEMIGDEVVDLRALHASAVLARAAQLLCAEGLDGEAVGLYPSDVKQARAYQELASAGRGGGKRMLVVTASSSVPSGLSLTFLAGLGRALASAPLEKGAERPRLLLRECRTREDIEDLSKLFASASLANAVVVVYAGETGPLAANNVLWLHASCLRAGFERCSHVLLSEGLQASVHLAGAATPGQGSPSPLRPVPLVEGVVPGVTSRIFTFLGPAVRKQTLLEVPGVEIEPIPLSSTLLATYSEGITRIAGKKPSLLGSAERDIELVSSSPMVLQGVCASLAAELLSAPGGAETPLSCCDLGRLAQLARSYDAALRGAAPGLVRPAPLCPEPVLCSDPAVLEAHGAELGAPESLARARQWLTEKPLARALLERLHSSLLRLQERASCPALRVVLDFGGFFFLEVGRRADGRSGCAVSAEPGASAAIADRRLAQLRAAAGEGKAVRALLCGRDSDRAWPALAEALGAAGGAAPPALAKPLAALTTCARNLTQSLLLELVHLSEAEAARMERERAPAPEEAPPATDHEVYLRALEKYAAEPLPKGWYYDGYYYMTMDGDRTTERPDKARLIARYRKEMGL